MIKQKQFGIKYQSNDAFVNLSGNLSGSKSVNFEMKFDSDSEMFLCK